MNSINRLLLLLGDLVLWVRDDALAALGGAFVWLSDLLNPVLAALFAWLNVPVNAAGRVLLSPIGAMPGWLSNTVIAGVTGVLLLLVFKYTSNQQAIARTRDRIKANMLALKLFKDELSVVLASQWRVFRGALTLLRHAMRPLLVMLVPVSLQLAQMGVWYQWRPVAPGEDVLVTVHLGGGAGDPLPEVKLEAPAGVEVVVGPVVLRTPREVVYRVRGERPQVYTLTFAVDGRRETKDLVVGEGLARVSAVRPGWAWTDILIHPLERPFPADHPIASIAVDYPDRPSWTSGTDYWVLYFFVASLVFALVFKPLVKVRI